MTSLDEAQTVEEIRDLDTSVKKEVAIEALSHLSPQEGAEAVRQSGLAPPGQGTSNIVWMMIVAAFCLVLIGGGYTLMRIALGHAAEGFNPELMVAVITLSAGFLTGLLTPSPIGGR
jgi:hypothetical protein